MVGLLRVSVSVVPVVVVAATVFVSSRDVQAMDDDGIIQVYSCELRADPAFAHVSGSPERARLRREVWDALTRFAIDAELSEHQWNALLGDLADLAAVEREIGASPDQRSISVHDDLEVWESLGAELMSRASQYLTDAQVSKFRFRFHAPLLISQVRGLDLLDLPGPPG